MAGAQRPRRPGPRPVGRTTTWPDQAGPGRARAAAPRGPRGRRPVASCGCSPGAWSLAGPRTRSSGARMINARVESVLEKPAFARGPRARRCLVPARGLVRVAGQPDGAWTRRASHASSRSSPTGRRRQRRHGRALRVLARPRRDRADDPLRLAHDVRHHHRPRRAGPGPDPRPPAARAQPEGWAAWLDPGRARPTSWGCSSGARPGASRPTRCRPP